MKRNGFIIRGISSISDVITNSSSEVYVMRKEDAEYYNNLPNTDGCVSITPIDRDFIVDNFNMSEYNAICHICKIEVDKEFADEIYKAENWFYGYCPQPKRPCRDIYEDFKGWIYAHLDEIEKGFEGLYWVDIEDHFADCMDVIEEAMDDSLWHDNRH